MNEWYILSLFLYFPEDKSEYIPAAMSFFVFFVAALLTMRFIIKVSKRDEEKAREFEERIMRDQKEEKKIDLMDT